MWKWETHRDVISELNNLLVCGELQWLEVAPGSRMHKHPHTRYQHRPLCMLSQWHRHTAHFMFRKLNIQLWHMLNLLYHHHCIMQRKPSPPLTTDEIFKCSATYEGRNTTKLSGWRRITRLFTFVVQVLFLYNKTRAYDNVRVATRTLVQVMLNVYSTGCNNERSERQSFAKLSYITIDNVLTNLLLAGLQDFFQVLNISNATMTVNKLLGCSPDPIVHWV